MSVAPYHLFVQGNRDMEFITRQTRMLKTKQKCVVILIKPDKDHFTSSPYVTPNPPQLPCHLHCHSNLNIAVSKLLHGHKGGVFTLPVYQLTFFTFWPVALT